MKVLEPGHKYKLLTLDGSTYQTLTFVKRVGAKFPGNDVAHPGTTLQSVIRALIERVEYLQNQIWAPENVVISLFLSWAIWLLEFRAARRHKRFYDRSVSFAVNAEMCPICGHTLCEHNVYEYNPATMELDNEGLFEPEFPPIRYGSPKLPF